jgi:hypothetical protein
MRPIPMLLGVVMLSSCSGSGLPNQFSGPATAGTALGCVTERLGGMGYQSVSGAATSGAVRLERENDEPFWLNMIGINDSVDVLDATMSGTELRLTAYSQILRGGERQSAAPSDDARREASETFDACT